MSKSKTKKKVVAKKAKVSNEGKLVKAINDLRVCLSDPALAKMLSDVLANMSTDKPKHQEKLPANTIGKMIPAEHPIIPDAIDVAPEPIAAVAPAVEQKQPAIIVEDRTTENVPADQAVGYRGELMEVEKLVGLKGPIACEVVNPDIAEHKAGWGKIAKARMPSLIILTGVNPSALGGDVKSISYARYSKEQDFKANTRDVLNTFVVKRLTGNQGAKMLKLYNEHRIKNLENNLVHSGTQVGCDPEIFVENKDGQVIPAFTFLGSKQDTKVRSQGAYGGMKVYWDGFQAEFETREGHCLAYHVDSIQAGLKAVFDAARVVDKTARLSAKTVMDTPIALLNKTDEKYKAFGCAPSLNAYGLTAKVSDPNELTFRPAGGHLHFGCGSQPDSKVVDGVKALDAILGVACVSLFRNFDNPVRRQYYGLPGEYRLPKHGIEYRTLSSAWLMHPILAHMVFELGRKALMFGLNGYRSSWVATEKEVIETIQNCDVKKATEILERNKEVFKRILTATALKDASGKTAELAFNAFMNGCESIIANPQNIAENWHLADGKWVPHSNGNGCYWGSARLSFAKGEKV